MIRFDQVSFAYSGSATPALREVNLSIGRGEFVGIIGASGAGKTTLTRCISGVVPLHFSGDFYGAVMVDGQDTIELGLDTLSQRIGSLSQDVDAQMVASMVEDELLFGLENFSVSHDQIEARMDEALAALGIRELRNRSISSLSGGQKQKVALAAMLALRPEILILDEPTGELDPASSRSIFELLRRLNREQGITIVVVEQKIMLLCEFAQRLLVMDQGAVAFDGPVRDVLCHSDQLEAIGVHVPRVVSLARKLERRGLRPGITPINVPEAQIMVEEMLHDSL